MKTATAPLEIQDLATEVVQVLKLSSPDIDVARIQQIKVRVGRLRDTQAAPAHYAEMVLFMCAYAIGDRAQLERAAREAIRLSNSNREILTNATIALSAMGNVRESVSLARQLFDRFPDDLYALDAALNTFQLNMCFDDAVVVCEAYQKLAINNLPKYWPTLRKVIDGAKMAIDQQKLTQPDLLTRLEAGIQIVRDQGFEVRRQSRLTLDDGSFIVQLFIDATPRICADINFEIGCSLSETFEDTGSSVFSVVSRPFSDAANVKSLEVLA